MPDIPKTLIEIGLSGGLVFLSSLIGRALVRNPFGGAIIAAIIFVPVYGFLERTLQLRGIYVQMNWADINWAIAGLLAGLAFVSLLVGRASVRNPFGGAIIAAIVFVAAYVALAAYLLRYALDI
jgi:hypothetical protein